MSLPTLRVRSRGNALVQSLESMGASPRKFIGREWVVVDGQHGTVSTDETVEIPNRAEYRQHVKECAFWAADEATAKECGVKFDPDFGAEPHADIADSQN